MATLSPCILRWYIMSKRLSCSSWIENQFEDAGVRMKPPTTISCVDGGSVDHFEGGSSIASRRKPWMMLINGRFMATWLSAASPMRRSPPKTKRREISWCSLAMIAIRLFCRTTRWSEWYTTWSSDLQSCRQSQYWSRYGKAKNSQRFVCQWKAGESFRVPFHGKQHERDWPGAFPTVFFSTILKMISPFSINIPSSKTRFDDIGSGDRKRFIPRGMVRLRICLPVHNGFGFKIAGVGIVPSQSGTQSRIFCTWFQSKKESRSVNMRIPQSVSCTMPITGLLAWGEIICTYYK